MSTLTIVISILLILFGLFGFLKGFGKGTAKSLASEAGLAAGYFFGVPVARLLMNTGMGKSWLTGLYLGTIPSIDPFTKALETGSDSGSLQAANKALLSEGLSTLGIPKFFQGMFLSHVVSYEADVRLALASSFAYWTLIAFFFLLFYLVVTLVLGKILSKAEGLVFGEDGKNFLGRLGGLVKGVLKGSGLILVLLVLLSLVNQLLMNAGNTVLNRWLVDDLAIEDGSKLSLGKFFYQTAEGLIGWVSTLKS